MIKDFSSKFLLIWVFAFSVFAQPNSPFTGTQQQGKFFENLWVGGGFDKGGMDLRREGDLRIRGGLLTRGTSLSWGDDFANTTPGASYVDIFKGNVPVLRIGTYLNSGFTGAEVFIGGENKPTTFGGAIDVNGGITFQEYLEVIAGDDVPSGHPYPGQTPAKFSYLTSDAVVLDLFRDENIVDIFAGGTQTRFRIGNRFIIDPSTNTIRTTGLPAGSTIGLFNEGNNITIGAAGRNITVAGNLIVQGTSTFQQQITGGVGTGGTGTGGTFTGALPTHYTGLWRLSFTASKPIIEADTNEYVYLFSGEFETNLYESGDPFLGLKPDTLLGMSSRPAVILGNASDVAIGHPDRIIRLHGTTHVHGDMIFESGVSWEDVTLLGKTTSEGPIEILDVEDDDRPDYRLSTSTPEGEGEFIEERDPEFVSQYEANPALETNKGLALIAESAYIEGGVVKLSYDNLPKAEPTGEVNKGALWISEGENTIMIAPGIDAPIPKINWYYGEGVPDQLIIYAQDASERSPDDEGEGEVSDTDPWYSGVALDVDFPTLTPDTPTAPWVSVNFGTKDDPGMRNVGGGIVLTYTISKNILGLNRSDSLIWEINPPTVACDAVPKTGVALPATITLQNTTVEEPIKAHYWKWEVVDPVATPIIISEEGEFEEFTEFELTEAAEGEGIGEVIANTQVTFRLTGRSLVNEDTAEVTILVLPAE